MNLLPIVQVLGSIALLAILRKVYLSDKLAHPERRGSPMIVFNRFFTIWSLFPINTHDRDKHDLVLIKKANAALKIFYWSFGLLIALGLLDVLI